MQNILLLFFACFFARFCIQYTYEKTVICRGAGS